ncbi:ABC transporter permease [Flavitalea sp.]|nr:ABC transporter permease [Flavitalea sp.]
MFKNYFTVAVRYLMRHKLISFINVFGLSIGITFCLIIGIYISTKKAVNSQIRNIDRQYVLKSNWKDDNTAPATTTVGPLAKKLKELYPTLIENYYRFDPINAIVSSGARQFREDIAIADTTLVSIYGFQLVAGNKAALFRDNRSAVVTESFAKKLFGRSDVLDKILTIHTQKGTKEDFAITAVLQDMPFNSVMNYNQGHQYEVFVPMESDTLFRLQHYGDNWSIVFVTGMVELKPGVDPAYVTALLPQVLKSNAAPWISSGLSAELSAMKDYHLEENNGTVRKMMDALTLVGLLILLMAVINFINISIGVSAWRIKEIGLRKVFGGNRRQLAIQHVFEALVLSFLAATLAVLFYEVARPAFNKLLVTTLTPLYDFNTTTIFTGLLFVALIGIIAGIYPSFVLSAVNVTTAVKGKAGSVQGGITMRKGLLIMQFSLAVAVFISSLVVSGQVSYLFTMDLGYKKDQVLIISSVPHKWDSAGIMQMESIRDQLATVNGTTAVSLSSNIPDGRPDGSGGLSPGGKGGKKLICPIIIADRNFAKVYGIPMKEGVFFSQESYMPGQIVLNESALKALGWETGTGKRAGRLIGKELTVAGVVRDFHIASLHENIEPLAIMNIRDMQAYDYLSLKLATTDIHKTVSRVEAKWKELFPGTPFEYFFMDEKFQAIYKADLQLKTASSIATALTLIIVLLGIVGVITFTLTKRTREIATRKVLGASAGRIIGLFLKEYAVLIFVSNLIAWPLAYFATTRWLENYAYRIQLTIVPFLTVAIFIFLTIAAAITIICFKTASSRPAQSLRSE